MATRRKAPSEPEKRPAHRPSGLTQERIKQAEKLCRLGATVMEIADFFEVGRRTVFRWRAESAAFASAMKLGKEGPDDRVEQSLFARAIGYEHEEVDIRVIDGVVVQTPIIKHYPPEPVACIFWLKNRRPEQWRDRQPAGAGEDIETLAAALRANVKAANAEAVPAPTAP
jgi:hypothetical protein